MEADRSCWCPVEDLQRIVCAQLESSCRETKAVLIVLRLHRPGTLLKDSPQPGLEMLSCLEGRATGGEIVLCSENEP